jgi:UDP-glucose 4-epimerase
LQHLRAGGENLTLNRGYGRGYSVLEVVDAIKYASGTDFPSRIGPRRPGDPAAIVARATRIRERLGWQPHYDDLSVIVTHALAWEHTIPAKPSAAA